MLLARSWKNKNNHWKAQGKLFLWAQSRVRASSGKQPLKDFWDFFSFNSETKELECILSLWSHIKSLLKGCFRQLLCEESSLPLVGQKDFEWSNSRGSPRGCIPFIQQTPQMHFHMRGTPDSDGIPVLQKHTVQWREVTDVYKGLWKPKRKQAWSSLDGHRGHLLYKQDHSLLSPTHECGWHHTWLQQAPSRSSNPWPWGLGEKIAKKQLEEGEAQSS